MAAVKAPLQPRKTPVQARSTYTVESIFEACIQVLLQSGIQRLTTTRVAERAGVSIGTLYQYFPNKQAMLLAVLERHLLHVAQAVGVACAEAKGQPVEVIARRLVDSFLDAKLERPDVSVALYSVAQEASGTAILARITQQAQLDICDLLATAPDARFVDLQLTTFVLSTSLVGPVQAVLAAGASRSLVQGVRAQMHLMIAAYLSCAATTESEQQPARRRHHG
ncbi:MAG: TetR/AcrR family transcriptional regulator [Pseudomonadota bacterium]